MDLKIGEKQTEMKLNYNYEVMREIKKIPNSEYKDSHTWLIHNVYVKEFLSCIKEFYQDVSAAMQTVNDNIDKHDKYYAEESKEVVKTVKIYVKENAKSVTLKFDYDPEVLKYIKTLEQKRYNQSSKTWSILKTDIDWLCKKLERLEWVDMSELEKHKQNHNKITISPSDFPHMKRTPHQYQLDVAELMVNEQKIINGLEAGLGKTMIDIMAAEKIGEKTLIVCPASVKENWRKEIHLVNPHADVVVLDGKDKWQSAQYVILNYDIIENFIDEIKADSFKTLIIDEAHKIRGINAKGRPTAKRGKYVFVLASFMDYIFPTTATPFINYTKDIFNLLSITDHPSADNWYAFANTYCGAVDTGFGKNYNGTSKQAELNERIYPTGMIRLLSSDHIQLPELVRSFIPVKINLSKYKKAVQDYLDNRESLETNGQHLVYLNAMRMKLAEEKAKKSVKMIKDLLEQNKQVVIFTNYTEVVDYLMDKFDKDAVKITGDVTSKERQKNVDLFQEGKKKVFIGNIEAASEGITLTAADTMIVIDFHWSPVVMVKQMEKRIHRLTQERPVNIQYLYAIDAEVDEMMVDMLEDKLNDASMIIDGKSETFFADELMKKI